MIFNSLNYLKTEKGWINVVTVPIFKPFLNNWPGIEHLAEIPKPTMIEELHAVAFCQSTNVLQKKKKFWVAMC